MLITKLPLLYPGKISVKWRRTVFLDAVYVIEFPPMFFEKV